MTPFGDEANGTVSAFKSREIMSTTTEPRTPSPADTDGADAMDAPVRAGTAGRKSLVPLPDAEQPHERDESPDSQVEGSGATDPERTDIDQASRDVVSGLVDTDRRGIPDDIPHQDQEQTHATRPPAGRP